MSTIAHATISLDGFIAGPEDDMTWVFETMPEHNPAMERVMNSAGAFLSGRRSYDIGRRDQREAFEGEFTDPQVVLTHRPPSLPDPSVEFVTEGLPEAVARGRELAGERDLLIAGGQMIRQALAAGLVDEVVLHIAPVALGGGVPLWDEDVARPGQLHATEVSQAGNVINVRYAVVRKTP